MPPSMPIPPLAEKVAASRLPQGTVRPAVIDALRGMSGARPADIAEKTGLKENSVRGTLNILKAEGVTDKRDNLWFLVEQIQSVSGTSSPSTNEAPAEGSEEASEPGEQGVSSTPNAFS